MSTGKNGRREAEPPRGRDMTIWGISDTELLAMLDDLCTQGDGWASTFDLRVLLGEHPEETGHRTGVPSRLSWLARYGWVERHETQRSHWRLTKVGHLILDRPALSKAVEGALSKLNPAQRVQLTRELAEGGADAPPEIRTAIRRQWTRSMGR